MKILVLGMGNPILTDDGVGLILAERLKKRVKGAEIAVNAMIGLELLDQIIGYDRIFIIDAMTSPKGNIGEMRIISETNGYGSLHLFSSHGLNIFDLMELGKRCGYQIPDLAAVYGIEIGTEVAFGMTLTQTLHGHIDDLEEAIVSDMLKRENLFCSECGVPIDSVFTRAERGEDRWIFVIPPRAGYLWNRGTRCRIVSPYSTKAAKTKRALKRSNSRLCGG